MLYKKKIVVKIFLSFLLFLFVAGGVWVSWMCAFREWGMSKPNALYLSKCILTIYSLCVLIFSLWSGEYPVAYWFLSIFIGMIAIFCFYLYLIAELSIA